jgi:2-(1,2-epoxy-1,2-dihydrophenyl)acetyl-CoA isomerase
VIAKVQATAAGGVMHLALACDIVVAAESASFVEAFVRRGIAPDAAGAWLLTRLVGLTKAKEMFFFGDPVSASEAARLGMVTKCVPDAELDACVDELAERLAIAPTRAIAITKFLTNRALDVDRTQALHDEAMGQELVTYTEDMREGIAAFVERRDPLFKGW